LTLFKKYYSDLQISDDDLNKLFILIEWFCISLDLILAFDMHRAQSFACLHELNSIPAKYKLTEKSIFMKNCLDLKNIEQLSQKFRNSFLNGTNDTEVESMIAANVLQSHRSYSIEKLIPKCRKVTTTVTKSEVHELIRILSQFSLCEIVEKLTGIKYVD
jgi:hypothetical protein